MNSTNKYSLKTTICKASWKSQPYRKDLKAEGQSVELPEITLSPLGSRRVAGLRKPRVPATRASARARTTALLLRAGAANRSPRGPSTLSHLGDV